MNLSASSDESTLIGADPSSRNFIFTINAGDSNGLFRIVDGNNLQTAKFRSYTAGLYILTIMASNFNPSLSNGAGLAETEVQSVTINIAPENQFFPQFIPSSGYAVTLFETQVSGVTVVTIFANDNDVSFNAIVYSIKNPSASPDNLFDVHSSTGAFFLKSPLDGTIHRAPLVIDVQATEVAA